MTREQNSSLPSCYSMARTWRGLNVVCHWTSWVQMPMFLTEQQDGLLPLLPGFFPIEQVRWIRPPILRWYSSINNRLGITSTPRANTIILPTRWQSRTFTINGHVGEMQIWVYARYLSDHLISSTQSILSLRLRCRRTERRFLLDMSLVIPKLIPEPIFRPGKGIKVSSKEELYILCTRNFCLCTSFCERPVYHDLRGTLHLRYLNDST